MSWQPRTQRWIHAASRQRGATLLEALAFLGVAAIVLIGALSLFDNSFTTATADRLVQETNAIATGTRTLYTQPGSGGYASMSMTDLANANVFPSTLSVTTTNGTVSVSNQWGGTVNVATSAGIPWITYTNVPQNVCVRVLVAGTNWTNISVNEVTQNLGVLTVAEAQTACATNNGQNGDQIAWAFE